MDRVANTNGPERPRESNPALDLSCAAAIDRNVLDSIRQIQREGAPDLLAKLIYLYVDSSPKYLEQMRIAVGSPDATAMIRAAHALRSSSASLGALNLAGLCGRLEEMGSAGSTKGAVTVLNELEAEYERVREALASEPRSSEEERL